MRSLIVGVLMCLMLVVPAWGEEECNPRKVIEVTNPEMELSNNCKISGDTAYMTFTSTNSYVAEEMWKDFILLRLNGVKKVVIYMNNAGGGAWDGKAITDQMVGLQKDGVHITVEAYGIIASAAVPPFLVADNRIAGKHTMFLIHPASMFKFIAKETEREIESQRNMLKMLKNSYADLVVTHSNLTREAVMELLSKDSWFTVDQAQSWGMVDEIR